MKIVVLADDVSFNNIKQIQPDADWVQVADVTGFTKHIDTDAFFDLSENAGNSDHPAIHQPFFINSVVHDLPHGNKAIRFNGWNGFLENEKWEVAGAVEKAHEAIFSYLGKTIIHCADEPGFISARIIAMIINEAYYALGENVSSKQEIDTAMKLGTNYPYGPFEWSEKIGVKNVYSLLKKLSLEDTRYRPAPMLSKTVEE